MLEPFRAGIIGCGGISAMHADNYLRSPLASLVAAADISPVSRDRFAAQHPEVHVYPSVDELLDREKLEMVSVCTPPAAHLEPALFAAQSGIRALLVEKPMALTLPDADRILEECARHHVKLGIGHQLRCSAPYRTARQLLDSGVIGPLHRIWGVCHAAPLQTNATHTIDLMRYFAADASTDWVMGGIDQGDSGRKLEGILQEEAGMGLFQFHDGPIALIETGRLTPNRGYHRIFLEGEDGQMELSRPQGPSLRLRTEATGGAWESPALLEDLNPVSNLIEAVHTGGEPLSGGAQGRAVLEIILAVFESSRTRRRVDLPLTNPGNPLEQIFAAG